MRTIEHWIAGTPTAGTSTRSGPVFNPATGERQASVAFAEPAEVDAAVVAAAKAFETWHDASLTRRARLMFAFRDLVERHEEELAGIVADEHGKVLADARGEVVRGREVVEFAFGIPHLLKPSERVPPASSWIAELYADAGLPDGVFNVVHGDKVDVVAVLDNP